MFLFILMGGGLLRPPACLQFVRKRQRYALPFLAHLFMHRLRICWENLRPRTLKFSSPGHVKWPHLIKSFNARHWYTDWRAALKLSAIGTNNSIYEAFASEFFYERASAASERSLFNITGKCQYERSSPARKAQPGLKRFWEAYISATTWPIYSRSFL